MFNLSISLRFYSNYLKYPALEYGPQTYVSKSITTKKISKKGLLNL